MRRYFFTGLLIWLPLAVTLWVLDIILTTLDRSLILLPPSWRPDALLGFHVPGFGLVLSLLIVFGTGIVAANIFGQRLLQWGEKLLLRVPLVGSIYTSVKQVSDTMLSQQGQSFRKAVLVEFPSRGQWAVGLLVGSPGPVLGRGLPDGVVSVYVATAPNPTSGYTIIVPESELLELDISVDEALKFIISLGVVSPIAPRPGARGSAPGAAAAISPGAHAPSVEADRPSL